MTSRTVISTTVDGLRKNLGDLRRDVDDLRRRGQWTYDKESPPRIEAFTAWALGQDVTTGATLTPIIGTAASAALFQTTGVVGDLATGANGVEIPAGLWQISASVTVTRASGQPQPTTGHVDFSVGPPYQADRVTWRQIAEGAGQGGGSVQHLRYLDAADWVDLYVVNSTDITMSISGEVSAVRLAPFGDLRLV